MSIEYTSKENHKKVLEKLARRLVSYEDDMKNVEGKLDDLMGHEGLASPMYFDVDGVGDLYVYYDDGFGAPNLEYDEDTGDLYWLFDVSD